MSHDSHTAALASDWLIFFSSMARTKKTPRMREGRKALQVRTRAEVHAAPEEEPVEPPALAEPPVPDVEAPPILNAIERRMAEVEKLEEVGRLLESSLTQQLAKVAAEAVPYTSDRRSQPAGSSNRPWEARLPRRNSSWLGK